MATAPILSSAPAVSFCTCAMNIFKGEEEESKALKGTLHFVEEYAV